MKILENYVHSFFLQIQMDDGDRLCLEFELKINAGDPMDNCTELKLTKKSKDFLGFYSQMSRENREVMKHLIEELAKKLWDRE